MGRKYLGSHICIITKNKKATKSNNGVIVVAHGGQRVNKTFPLEGGEVWFYAPDGATLQENMYYFIRGRIATHWYEKVTGGSKLTCPDYELSKSISYHQGDYYAQIGKKQISKDLEDDPKKAEENAESDYKYLEKLVEDGTCQYDIVSIRNRWFCSGTTFGEVMKKLKKEGYGYATIHCYFCRSAPVNPKVWDVELKKFV